MSGIVNAGLIELITEKVPPVGSAITAYRPTFGRSTGPMCTAPPSSRARATEASTSTSATATGDRVPTPPPS